MAYLDSIINKHDLSEGWDVVDRTQRSSRGAASDALAAMLVAALVLALFNSEGLVYWARSLPPSEVATSIYKVAAVWDERMQSHGLHKPQARIHSALETIRSERFDDIERKLKENGIELTLKHPKAFTPQTRRDSTSIPPLRGQL